MSPDAGPISLCVSPLEMLCAEIARARGRTNLCPEYSPVRLRDRIGVGPAFLTGELRRLAELLSDVSWPAPGPDLRNTLLVEYALELGFAVFALEEGYLTWAKHNQRAEARYRYAELRSLLSCRTVRLYLRDHFGFLQGNIAYWERKAEDAKPVYPSLEEYWETASIPWCFAPGKSREERSDPALTCATYCRSAATFYRELVARSDVNTLNEVPTAVQNLHDYFQSLVSEKGDHTEAANQIFNALEELVREEPIPPNIIPPPRSIQAFVSERLIEEELRLKVDRALRGNRTYEALSSQGRCLPDDLSRGWSFVPAREVTAGLEDETDKEQRFNKAVFRLLLEAGRAAEQPEDLKRALFVFPLTKEKGEHSFAHVLCSVRQPETPYVDASESRSPQCSPPGLERLRLFLHNLGGLVIQDQRTRVIEERAREEEHARTQRLLHQGWAHAMKNALFPIATGVDSLYDANKALATIMHLILVPIIKMRELESSGDLVSALIEYFEELAAREEEVRAVVKAWQWCVKFLDNSAGAPLIKKINEETRAEWRRFAEDACERFGVPHVFRAANYVPDRVDTIARQIRVLARLNTAVLRASDPYKPCRLDQLKKNGVRLQDIVFASLDKALFTYLYQIVRGEDKYLRGYQHISRGRLSPDELERVYRPVLEATGARDYARALKALDSVARDQEIPLLIRINLPNEEHSDLLGLAFESDPATVLEVALWEILLNALAYCRRPDEVLPATVSLTVGPHSNTKYGFSLQIRNSISEDQVAFLSAVHGKGFKVSLDKSTVDYFGSKKLGSLAANMKFIDVVAGGRDGTGVTVSLEGRELCCTIDIEFKPDGGPHRE